MSWLSKAMHGDIKSILKLGGAGALAFFGGPAVFSALGGGGLGAGEAIGGGMGDLIGGLGGAGAAGAAGGGGGLLGGLGSLLGKGDMGDYLELAQLGLGGYQSLRNPKFSPVPQSDEEKQMWKLYLAHLNNPAINNNLSTVSNYANQALGSLHPTWQSPKTFNGQTGYNGYSGFQYMPQSQPSGNPPGGVTPGGAPGGSPIGHPTSTPFSGADGGLNAYFQALKGGTPPLY